MNVADALSMADHLVTLLEKVVVPFLPDDVQQRVAPPLSLLRKALRPEVAAEIDAEMDALEKATLGG